METAQDSAARRLPRKQARRVYDVPEMSNLTGLPPQTIYRMAPRLPHLRIGGRLLFPKAAIDAWLDNGDLEQPAK